MSQQPPRFLLPGSPCAPVPGSWTLFPSSPRAWRTRLPGSPCVRCPFRDSVARRSGAGPGRDMASCADILRSEFPELDGEVFAYVTGALGQGLGGRC